MCVSISRESARDCVYISTAINRTLYISRVRIFIPHECDTLPNEKNTCSADSQLGRENKADSPVRGREKKTFCVCSAVLSGEFKRLTLFGYQFLWGCVRLACGLCKF